MPNNASVPTSRAAIIAAAEAAKVTSNKSAAATVVTNMATDVTNGNFAAASKKALDLARRYGELAANKQP